MANRIPLVVSDNKIKELPVGDSLNLSGNSIVNATSIAANNVNLGGTVFTGSYTELTNTPTIPTDINQLTDTSNLLSSGGGTTVVQGQGGGLIVAGDDSTQVTILPSNTLQIAGGTGITTAITDVAGTQKLTITNTVVDTNTTYTFNAVDGATSNSKTLQVVDSAGAVQNVSLKQGTNIGITRIANELTISSTNTDTTYGIESATDSNGFQVLRLSGSNSVTDDVAIKPGTNISITRATSDEITINNTQTLPNVFGTIAVAGQSSILADSTTDTLTIAGGNGITVTTDANSDTLTISTSTQNLFETFTADSGTTTANSGTDTLTISGGTGISTSITGDTLTIAYTGAGSGQSDEFSNIAVGVPGNNQMLTADDPNDILYINGGTGINITASGTGAGSNVDQITIENSAPNIVQNVFQTIQVDGAATTTANTATDTLTIQGGTDITTSLNGDVITISYTGSGGGGGGSVNDAFKTIAISPSGGSVVADASEDTLTLENGNNISMTATAGTDTITINATASGLNEQVQFNNSGNFGGDADFTYNSTTNTLTIKNLIAESVNPPSTLTGTYTISSPTTITLDPTSEIINDAPMKLKGYTVAQLGTLTSSAGAMVYCTDETGGSIPAFYDGTNWRRVSDRAIVS
jgi:hypothetical protein